MAVREACGDQRMREVMLRTGVHMTRSEMYLEPQLPSRIPCTRVSTGWMGSILPQNYRSDRPFAAMAQPVVGVRHAELDTSRGVPPLISLWGIHYRGELPLPDRVLYLRFRVT